ncbi:protein transport protein HofC [Orbus sturtevantii]|uniref:protein transport protein HofC n=1 Tax=Orbus sturtevantii TaxID=3074109 RepID=UPI00370DE26F
MNKRWQIKRFYQWQDLRGTKHVLVARSLAEAKQALLQNQEFFFKLTAKKYLTYHSFKVQELVIITKQLATMLNAGLPIINSLDLLANQNGLIQWKWLLDSIKQQIMTGESISQAISNYSKIFPVVYVQIVATGELTGQLEHSFEIVALQLENTQKLKKRVKKAMRYPLFLFTVSAFVTLIMLLVVLPKFAEVYQNFDAQLPWFTQLIITFSACLQHNFLTILVIITSIYLCYRFYVKKRHNFLIIKYLLKLPIIGQIIKTSCLTMIFQTLFITQKSGIPLLSGLKSAKKTTENLLFRLSLVDIIKTIEQGLSFSQAIERHTIYPNLCSQLIRIGEESGTLDLMLQRLGDYYQQQNLELTDNLSQKIEPLMMSIMALIIGSLVIGMYLPVFQLGSVIH